MTAQFIPVGEPAHDAERQALRLIVEGLPDHYVVYGNPWLVERGGAVNELDAVVVAPHAIYVVEVVGERKLDLSTVESQFESVTPLPLQPVVYRGRTLHRLQMFECRNLR